MSWEALSAILGAFFAACVPLVKWAVNTWSQKMKETDSLRTRDIARQVKHIELFIDTIKHTSNSLQDRVADLSKRILETEKFMRRLDDKIDEAVITMERVSKDIEKSVDRSVKTEILKLKRDLVMIRDKNRKK